MPCRFWKNLGSWTPSHYAIPMHDAWWSFLFCSRQFPKPSPILEHYGVSPVLPFPRLRPCLVAHSLSFPTFGSQPNRLLHKVMSHLSTHSSYLTPKSPETRLSSEGRSRLWGENLSWWRRNSLNQIWEGCKHCISYSFVPSHPLCLTVNDYPTFSVVPVC